MIVNSDYTELYKNEGSKWQVKMDEKVNKQLALRTKNENGIKGTFPEIH